MDLLRRHKSLLLGSFWSIFGAAFTFHFINKSNRICVSMEGLIYLAPAWVKLEDLIDAYD